MRRELPIVRTVDPELAELGKARLLSDTAQRRIYFAHIQPLYGTREELDDIRTIQAHFPGAKIVNPADVGDLHIGDMLFYTDVVGMCDALVFKRTRINGMMVIFGGVGLEMDYALDRGKEVYELVGGKLARVNSAPDYLDRDETRAALLKMGFRKQE